MMILSCSDHYKKFIREGWHIVDKTEKTVTLRSPGDPNLFKRIIMACDTNTYVCNKAYEGEAANGGFNDASETEFTRGEYPIIKTDDNNYVLDTGSQESLYQYHRFEFIITEQLNTINQVDILWRGNGGQADDVTVPGHSLWVKEGATYVKKASGTSSTKETLTAQYTSGFNNIIQSGTLYVGTQSDYVTTYWVDPPMYSFIYSYYTEVVITYRRPRQSGSDGMPHTI